MTCKLKMYILMINKAIKFSSFFVIFLGLFSKRNRKHFLCVSIKLWKHSWKFGRTQKNCGNTRLRLVFPQHFLFSQTSPRVSITLLSKMRHFSFSHEDECLGKPGPDSLMSAHIPAHAGLSRNFHHLSTGPNINTKEENLYLICQILIIL